MTDTDCLQQLLALAGPAPALTLVEGRHTRLAWNFDELQHQRRHAERVLTLLGLKAGDRVLLVCDNCPQVFAVLLATLALRLCLCPLVRDSGEAQLQHIVRQQQPSLVILDDPQQQHRFPACSVLQLLPLQEDWLQPLAVIGPRPTSTAANDVAPDDLPLLLFHSSGSTGSPKAIRYTRRTWHHFFARLRELYAAFPDQERREPPSPRVCVLPLLHFGGLSFCVQALLDGRCVHLLREHTTEDHLALLARSRCELVLMVPALLQAMLACEVRTALPALRHCLVMGEAISVAQLRQLSAHLGLPVHNAYGMSECLTGIYNRADEPAPPGSCGRLRFGEVRLLADDGSEAQREGELCVRNETTEPCYTDAALNLRKYCDHWFHTGDRLRRDDDGYYFFVGRCDQMCVINGRNIYPQEVEQVFMAHPAVAACAVLPLPDIAGRQRLVLLAQLRPGTQASAEALTDFYLEYGALYAVPTRVALVEALPRLAGGKVDRQACHTLAVEVLAPTGAAA